MIKDVMVRLRASIGDFKRGFKEARDVFVKFNSKARTAGNTVAILNRKFQKFTHTFQGWALSIMFFGMAIE